MVIAKLTHTNDHLTFLIFALNINCGCLLEPPHPFIMKESHAYAIKLIIGLAYTLCRRLLCSFGFSSFFILYIYIFFFFFGILVHI